MQHRGRSNVIAALIALALRTCLPLSLAVYPWPHGRLEILAFAISLAGVAIMSVVFMPRSKLKLKLVKKLRRFALVVEFITIILFSTILSFTGPPHLPLCRTENPSDCCKLVFAILWFFTIFFPLLASELIVNIVDPSPRPMAGPKPTRRC
jgi:hypothetical protein